MILRSKVSIIQNFQSYNKAVIEKKKLSHFTTKSCLLEMEKKTKKLFFVFLILQKNMFLRQKV